MIQAFVPGTPQPQGYEAGEERERNRISVMAQARICFDFHNSGVCDHSVCYGMAELIIAIRQAQDDQP